MLTILNPVHGGHAPRHELFRGRLVPAFEVPARVELVAAAIGRHGLGPVVGPVDHGLAAVERVHDARYLRFLQGAWGEWCAMQPGVDDPGDALPAVWPVPGLRRDVEPVSFAARLGLHAMDAGTPLTAGSWDAALAGAHCALTGLDRLAGGERAAFALTRPPGHHAGRDFMGGYCFLNTAAIAAQAAVDRGAARVAVLDVDYHHGNGTQALFYDRADVMFVSIHGDPRTEYPFYLGHPDETGEGAGRGANLNLPLPAGSPVADWFDALGVALQRIRAHRPEVLVVSLGVDTYAGDPISHFGLQRPDFARLGAALGALALPTLYVMEGGYAVEPIGEHVVAVLRGHDDAAV